MVKEEAALPLLALKIGRLEAKDMVCSQRALISLATKQDLDGLDITKESRAQFKHPFLVSRFWCLISEK